MTRWRAGLIAATLAIGLVIALGTRPAQAQVDPLDRDWERATQLFQAGKYREVVDRLNILAKQVRARFGENSSYARVLALLGDAYQAPGRQQEAEDLLNRALVIQQRRLEADHPDVAATLGDLSQVYTLVGDSKIYEQIAAAASPANLWLPAE